MTNNPASPKLSYTPLLKTDLTNSCIVVKTCNNLNPHAGKNRPGCLEKKYPANKNTSAALLRFVRNDLNAPKAETLSAKDNFQKKFRDLEAEAYI
jgi:hypothetical protein